MDPKLARGLARQYLRDIPSPTLTPLPERIGFNKKAIERIRRRMKTQVSPTTAGIWFLTVPKRKLSFIELYLARGTMNTTRHDHESTVQFDEECVTISALFWQFERKAENYGLLIYDAGGFGLHALSRYLERADDIDRLNEAVTYASRWAIPSAHAASLNEKCECILPARGGAFVCDLMSVSIIHASGSWENEKTATFVSVRTFLSDEMTVANSFAELRSFCSDNDAHLEKHGPTALGLERERNLAGIFAANATMARGES